MMYSAYTDGHIVAVRKAGGDFGELSRHIIHGFDEVFNRHGGNYIVARESDFFAGFFVDDAREPVVFIFFDADNLSLGDYSAAFFLDFFSGDFPVLAGAKFGI